MNNEKPQNNRDKKLKKLSKNIKYSLIIIFVSILILITAIIFYKHKDFPNNPIAALLNELPQINNSSKDTNIDPNIKPIEKPQEDFSLQSIETHKTNSIVDSTNLTTNNDFKLSPEHIKNKDLIKFNLNKLYAALLQGSDRWEIYATFLESFYHDDNLINLLKKLKNTKLHKIPTTYEILNDFDIVYMEIDLYCLQATSTLWNDLKYLFAKLIYIKNTSSNAQINNSHCENNLNDIQNALENDQLDKAYNLFVQYKMYVNDITSNWGKKLEARIITDNILQYLDNLIENNN